MPDVTLDNAADQAKAVKSRLTDIARRQEMLREPFSEEETLWKPQTIKGDKALAIAYVDRTLVMERLDKVYTHEGWFAKYRELPNGCVVCTLSVLVEDRWLAKEDVGSPSDQPDDGDKTKAAFSDALKRAATHFGIGRYLYDLPKQWVAWDAGKRDFAHRPFIGVTSEQRDKLTAVAKRIGVFVPTVCAVYRVLGLENLRLGLFGHAKGWLESLTDPAYVSCLNDLVATIHSTSADLKQFLETSKVKSLAQLPQDRIVKATEWLKGQAKQAKSA